MNAAVASNTINGNCWPGFLSGGRCVAASQTTATRCTDTTPGSSGGMEINGWGHTFYNNDVTYNAGGGIAVNLVGSNYCPNGPGSFQCCTAGPRSQGCMEGHLAITSNNPWYAGDTPKFVYQNTYHGITVLGPPDFSSFQGVTLDNLLVAANAGYGIDLEGVSADSPYSGFINGACLYPSPDLNKNTNGTVNSTPPPRQGTFGSTGIALNLLSSYGSLVTPNQPGYANWSPGFLTSLQSGVCPTPGSTQAPALWLPSGWPQ